MPHVPPPTLQPLVSVIPFLCECVWFLSAKTAAASIDGREKMKDRWREERKRENSKGGREGGGEKAEWVSLLRVSFTGIRIHNLPSEWERRGEVLSINNAGVWQCRHCTNIMAPNTASALSLNGIFFIYFFKSKLIPPTHSSGDISKRSLTSRLQCCKRLCWSIEGSQWRMCVWMRAWWPLALTYNK